MSTLRGQANQSLYLAKILLQAWQRDLADEQVAARALCQAYLPAMRLHLQRAYGWFLLEISRPDQVPASPPGSTDELPGITEGKALPPEIRECGLLERSGWLAQLLDDGQGEVPAASSAGNLAAPAGEAGLEEASAWVEQLQSMFDRMGDSLDEY